MGTFPKCDDKITNCPNPPWVHVLFLEISLRIDVFFLPRWTSASCPLQVWSTSWPRMVRGSFPEKSTVLPAIHRPVDFFCWLSWAFRYHLRNHHRRHCPHPHRVHLRGRVRGPAVAHEDRSTFAPEAAMTRMSRPFKKSHTEVNHDESHHFISVESLYKFTQ